MEANKSAPCVTYRWLYKYEICLLHASEATWPYISSSWNSPGWGGNPAPIAGGQVSGDLVEVKELSARFLVHQSIDILLDGLGELTKRKKSNEFPLRLGHGHGLGGTQDRATNNLASRAPIQPGGLLFDLGSHLLWF